ncbi:uncharacterized protein LOC135164763 [Diachasmimorpha longicaudata]|uniref:uncharacterized protein LOC135164763 n=1 Tax=Diachasmimorpha longicaudata TaxID=58733 RepID=UPI0030B8EEBB
MSSRFLWVCFLSATLSRGVEVEHSCSASTGPRSELPSSAGTGRPSPRDGAQRPELPSSVPRVANRISGGGGHNNASVVLRSLRIVSQHARATSPATTTRDPWRVVPSRIRSRPPCAGVLPSRRGKGSSLRAVREDVAEIEGLTQQPSQPTPGSSRPSAVNTQRDGIKCSSFRRRCSCNITEIHHTLQRKRQIHHLFVYHMERDQPALGEQGDVPQRVSKEWTSIQGVRLLIKMG